jgi:exopolysaccharide biosynthesis polyprenyl glycosylphosphotransferase
MATDTDTARLAHVGVAGGALHVSRPPVQFELAPGAEAAPERLAPILRTTRVRAQARLISRALLFADLTALVLAFVLTDILIPRPGAAYVVFLASAPAWAVGAKLLGLYQRDQRHIGHSTVDELAAIFVLVTVGTFVLGRLALVAPGFRPDLVKLTLFWAWALLLVTWFRTLARHHARGRHAIRTLIVGTGIVGQLVARKLRRHPEYGLELVGFVAGSQNELPPDLAGVPVHGGAERLPALARTLGLDRVIVAFPAHKAEEIVELLRPLRDDGVQVDIVPRLFDTLGPAASMHSLEGLPLIALPAARLSRPSFFIKRCIDVVGALAALTAAAPLIAITAWRIKRDSPGPVFFRQTRLGMDMREFTILKFRTMRADTSDAEHRAFVRTVADRNVAPETNGLFKLEHAQAVTNVGRWLRGTSLDELPQLWNVLRGDMSLVGPRPCIPYEIENFAPQHFDRFRVPAGLTGLWQVTARARSTFAEALDMDVAYARSWSLGLDVRLLLLTPRELLRRKSTT